MESQNKDVQFLLRTIVVLVMVFGLGLAFRPFGMFFATRVSEAISPTPPLCEAMAEMYPGISDKYDRLIVTDETIDSGSLLKQVKAIVAGEEFHDADSLISVVKWFNEERHIAILSTNNRYSCQSESAATRVFVTDQEVYFRAFLLNGTVVPLRPEPALSAPHTFPSFKGVNQTDFESAISSAVDFTDNLYPTLNHDLLAANSYYFARDNGIHCKDMALPDAIKEQCSLYSLEINFPNYDAYLSDLEALLEPGEQCHVFRRRLSKVIAERTLSQSCYMRESIQDRKPDNCFWAHEVYKGTDTETASSYMLPTYRCVEQVGTKLSPQYCEAYRGRSTGYNRLSSGCYEVLAWQTQNETYCEKLGNHPTDGPSQVSTCKREVQWLKEGKITLEK